jgi:hypothetical protein
MAPVASVPDEWVHGTLGGRHAGVDQFAADAKPVFEVGAARGERCRPNDIAMSATTLVVTVKPGRHPERAHAPAVAYAATAGDVRPSPTSAADAAGTPART